MPCHAKSCRDSHSKSAVDLFETQNFTGCTGNISAECATLLRLVLASRTPLAAHPCCVCGVVAACRLPVVDACRLPVALSAERAGACGGRRGGRRRARGRHQRRPQPAAVLDAAGGPAGPGLRWAAPRCPAARVLCTLCARPLPLLGRMLDGAACSETLARSID